MYLVGADGGPMTPRVKTVMTAAAKAKAKAAMLKMMLREAAVVTWPAAPNPLPLTYGP